MYASRPTLAVIGTTGIVLGAWYLLTLVRKVFFGPLKEPALEGHGTIQDLNVRELLALLPIVALCLLLGVYPQPAIDASRPDLQVIADIVEKRGQAHTAQTVPVGQPEAAGPQLGRRNDGE
jgi:NADH-quinone oxidoreductase subunit M